MSSTASIVVAVLIIAASIAGIVWFFRRGIRHYEEQRRAAARAISMDVSTTPTAPVQNPADRVVAVDAAGTVIVEREKELIDRITANPRDTEAYELLGQTYVAQGNLNDAAECFQQILVLAPENLRAVEQLKRIARLRTEQQG